MLNKLVQILQQAVCTHPSKWVNPVSNTSGCKRCNKEWQGVWRLTKKRKVKIPVSFSK